jgi:AraC-like DNA-binding protein
LLTLTTFGLVIFGGVLQGWIAGAQLRMSERTLNRRLNDAGTQFRSLLDDVRRERAQHLLQHTQLGISDIAQRLGFGDATAFGRAFRRCFGVSPSQFRAL